MKRYIVPGLSFIAATALLVSACGDSGSAGAPSESGSAGAPSESAPPTALPASEWTGVVCAKAATVVAQVRDTVSPSVLNGTPDELAEAQVWLTYAAQFSRSASEVLAVPLDPTYEAQVELFEFWSQQSDWNAGWLESLRDEMSEATPEDAVLLWRQTDPMDEMYDRQKALDMYAETPPAVPSLDLFDTDKFERQASELELYMEEFPGCSDALGGMRPATMHRDVDL